MKTRYLALVLAGLLMLPPLAGCGGSTRKDIARVYVSHALEGLVGKEFMTDLQSGAFWSYYNTNMDHADARDPNAPDEGFTFVKELDQEEIDRFRQAAERYGFRNWAKDGKDYHNTEILPSREWNIRVVYSDGTEDSLSGNNAFPDAWNDMNEAFKTLTGEGVLEPGRIGYH